LAFGGGCGPGFKGLSKDFVEMCMPCYMEYKLSYMLRSHENKRVRMTGSVISEFSKKLKVAESTK